ncbi:hypothetical protein ACLKA7_012883 [Drosophila subpalustris]
MHASVPSPFSLELTTNHQQTQTHAVGQHSPTVPNVSPKLSSVRRLGNCCKTERSIHMDSNSHPKLCHDWYQFSRITISERGACHHRSPTGCMPPYGKNVIIEEPCS